jgi:hypothetical protein
MAAKEFQFLTYCYVLYTDRESTKLYDNVLYLNFQLMQTT